MIRQKEANWDLYYIFENILHEGDERKIIEILNQFDVQDYLEIPIILDLISHKKIRLLKLLHTKNIPLTYEEECGGNGLHVACGAGGSLECVKFLIENDILTDIHKKSGHYGETPLTLAISYEQHDIVAYFKQKFEIKNITLEDLYVILDRVKSNYRMWKKSNL